MQKLMVALQQLTNGGTLILKLMGTPPLMLTAVSASN
jgi:hypothetical protein